MNIVRTASKLALLAGILTCSTGAATYVVDQKHPAAADGNSGTEEAPFKTIGAAVALVQPGDRVVVRPGIYREYVGIPRSGTSDQPIRLEADPPGKAIISGADVLTGWQSVDGRPDIAWVPWQKDFIINQRKEGEKVIYIRNHGAPSPTGCAEWVLWEGRPLRQTMSAADLQAASFFADWDADRLYVCLPAGVKHQDALIEGGMRTVALGPLHRNYKQHQAHHVHVKGFVIRHAPGFAQRPPVYTDSHWTLEDCVMEWNASSGLSVKGDHVRLIRCIARYNGFGGFGGSRCNDVLVQDCETSYNNRKGFSPSWEGGGGKWLETRGLRIVNHIARFNAGPGIWLDWKNQDFVIRNCVAAGNFGVNEAWEGSGIFTEANNGPGLIEGNTVYSNTGSGIAVAETSQVVVRNNLLADNGNAFELRAMEGRGENLELKGVTIRENSLKSWRGAAVSLSLGKWPTNWPEQKQITLDANTYDPEAKGPVLRNGKLIIEKSADLRTLGLEHAGQVAPVRFEHELLPSAVLNRLRQASIAAAIAKAKPGSEVELAINGRTELASSKEGWQTEFYDLDNRHVHVTIPNESLKRRLVELIPAWPRTEQVKVKVQLLSSDAGQTETKLVSLP